MKECGRIEGITFDVGGTLIEPWPSVGHIYSEVARDHGLRDIPAELLNTRFKAAWSSLGKFDYTRRGWEQLVNLTFEGVTAAPLPSSFFPALYDRFAEPDVWRVFDDVEPVLKALSSQRIRLAVLSNWDERLRLLLDRLHLREHFEVVVISCEVGFAKPSRMIFERAAAGFGLRPESILHVGDSRAMDVEGAVSAGFRALHLRRAQQPSTAGEIASLSELAGKLAAG